MNSSLSRFQSRAASIERADAIRAQAEAAYAAAVSAANANPSEAAFAAAATAAYIYLDATTTAYKRAMTPIEAEIDAL
jgi:hypothetical protein